MAPRRLLLPLLLLVIAAARATDATTTAWLGKTTLDEQTTGYAVSYAVVGGSKLRLKLEIPNAPADEGFWFGFGLSESGGMAGSDVVTVEGVNAVGRGGKAKPTVTDRFVPYAASPLTTPPLPDPVSDSAFCGGKQDWVLISATSTSSSTTPTSAPSSTPTRQVSVVLERALVTGDASDRAFSTTHDNRVVWSWGLAVSATAGVAYHGPHRGTTMISLAPQPAASSAAAAINSIPDLAEWTWLNMTIPVSSSLTTQYVCLGFDLGETERHAVVVDPVITGPGSQYAHHVILHACGNTPGPAYQLSTPIATACRTKDLTAVGTSVLGSMGCTSTLHGWAPGIGPLILPLQSGFRVGGSGARYVVFEIHVNNPGLDEGQSMTASMRLGLTPVGSFRPENAGTMVIGDPALTLDMNPLTFAKVNPLQAGKVTAKETACMSACTAAKMRGPVQVFASVLHGHQLMQSSWTNHFSANGTHLGVLDSSQFWSFDHQQVHMVQATINPGDRLNTHCVYDLTKSAANVPFGQPSNNEMCIHFLFVTPIENAVTYCGMLTTAASMCGNSMQQVFADLRTPAYAPFLIPNPYPSDGETSIPASVSVGPGSSSCTKPPSKKGGGKGHGKGGKPGKGGKGKGKGRL